MNDLQRVEEELSTLRQQVEALQAQARTRRRRTRVLLGLGVAAGLVGGFASAANGACPNGLPFCFTPNTPALASEVNHNFMQLKEWLEAKAGPTSASGLTASNGLVATAGASISPSLAVSTALPVVVPPGGSTRAASFTGTTNQETDPIVEISHTNLTQGVGIGWNSVVAIGTSANQDLRLQARGTGSVRVTDDFVVTGRATFGGRTCRNLSTSCQTQGSGEAVYLDRHDLDCANDEFLKRVRLINCGGNTMRYDFTCCAL